MQLNAPIVDADQVEAPPGYLRLDLKRSVAASDWDKVLEHTESAMLLPCARTWLDLQRYTSQALAQKGFAGTARVIGQCLRLHLETLPSLVEMTLPDDTPAANSETRDWIENFIIIQRVPMRTPEEIAADTPSDDSSSSDFSFDSSSESTDSSSTESTDDPYASFSSDDSTTEPEAVPEPEPSLTMWRRTRRFSAAKSRRLPMHRTNSARRWPPCATAGRPRVSA